MVPRRKVCKADAVPLSTRLEEPEPLTTDTPPALVADKLPEATLKVRVSASSAAALPSSSAALVKSREDSVPAVICKAAGALVIPGANAAPVELEAGCAAEMLAVLVNADWTIPPETTCADTAKE